MALALIFFNHHIDSILFK